MARSKATPVRSTLRGVLGPQRIQSVAKEHEVVRRKRKLDLFLLVWTLVLGFEVGAERRLTGLRQVYPRAAGHSIAPSAFYGRLNARLAKLLHRLVQDTLTAQPTGARMPQGALSGFEDLLAIDATVLRLHDLLSRPFRRLQDEPHQGRGQAPRRDERPRWLAAQSEADLGAHG